MVGPHLYQSKFSIDRNGQQRERYANVVVQIAMRGVHVHAGAQNGLDELLGGGFAIASSEAKNGGFKSPPVGLRQFLECGEPISDMNDAFSRQGGVINNGGNAALCDGIVGKGVAIEPFSL